MAAASDIFAADARFVLSETRLVLIPAVIGTFVIAKVAKVGGAREIFLTGSRMDAGRARNLGLVSHLASAGEPDGIVRREIDAAPKAAPEARKQARRLCSRIATAAIEDHLEIAVAELGDCRESEEARTGL